LNYFINNPVIQFEKEIKMSNSILRNLVENMINEALTDKDKASKIVGPKELKMMGAINPEREKRKSDSVRRGVSFTSYDLPKGIDPKKMAQDLDAMGYEMKSSRSKGTVKSGWIDADYTYAKKIYGKDSSSGEWTVDKGLHQLAFIVDKETSKINIIYANKI
jgi:hypothetical protein